jgi:hypothetical protein
MAVFCIDNPLRSSLQRSKHQNRVWHCAPLTVGLRSWTIFGDIPEAAEILSRAMDKPPSSIINLAFDRPDISRNFTTQGRLPNQQPQQNSESELHADDHGEGSGPWHFHKGEAESSDLVEEEWKHNEYIGSSPGDDSSVEDDSQDPWLFDRSGEAGSPCSGSEVEDVPPWTHDRYTSQVTVLLDPITGRKRPKPKQDPAAPKPSFEEVMAERQSNLVEKKQRR